MIYQSIIELRNELFNKFMQSVFSTTVIGLSMIGKNIGRNGEISWILINANNQLFYLDVITLGNEIFNDLKEIFEDPHKTKIIHDCRSISEFLWHKYKINIMNVYDTQVADIIIHRSLNKLLLPKELLSLHDCIVKYVTPSQDQIVGFKTLLISYQENPDLLFERPANDDFRKMFFNSIKYLRQLRQAQLFLILKDLQDGVDIHKGYYRDAPSTDVHRLKCYNERVPYQYNQIVSYAAVARKNETENLQLNKCEIMFKNNAYGKFTEQQNIYLPKDITKSKQSIIEINEENVGDDELKYESIIADDSSNDSSEDNLSKQYIISGSENYSRISAKMFKKLDSIQRMDIESLNNAVTLSSSKIDNDETVEKFNDNNYLDGKTIKDQNISTFQLRSIKNLGNNLIKIDPLTSDTTKCTKGAEVILPEKSLSANICNNNISGNITCTEVQKICENKINLSNGLIDSSIGKNCTRCNAHYDSEMNNERFNIDNNNDENKDNNKEDNCVQNNSRVNKFKNSFILRAEMKDDKLKLIDDKVNFVPTTNNYSSEISPSTSVDFILPFNFHLETSLNNKMNEYNNDEKVRNEKITHEIDNNIIDQINYDNLNLSLTNNLKDGTNQSIYASKSSKGSVINYEEKKLYEKNEFLGINQGLILKGNINTLNDYHPTYLLNSSENLPNTEISLKSFLKFHMSDEKNHSLFAGSDNESADSFTSGSIYESSKLSGPDFIKFIENYDNDYHRLQLNNRLAIDQLKTLYGYDITDNYRPYSSMSNYASIGCNIEEQSVLKSNDDIEKISNNFLKGENCNHKNMDSYHKSFKNNVLEFIEGEMYQKDSFKSSVNDKNIKNEIIFNELIGQNSQNSFAVSDYTFNCKTDSDQINIIDNDLTRGRGVLLKSIKRDENITLGRGKFFSLLD